MAAQRRREIQDIEDTLQKQTYYQHPGRYEELFLANAPYTPEPLTVAGRDIEEVVTDIDEMDAYFAGLEAKREISGAQLFDLLPDEQGGWI